MSSRNSCHSARVLQLRHLSGKQIFRPRCGSGGFKSFDHRRKINSFLETVNVATKCHGVPSHSGPTRPLGRPWTLARIKAKIKSSPLLLLCFYNNNFQLVSTLLLGEKKSPVENKTFHYWQKQLTKSVHSWDDVILLWLHWGSVSTRTRDSDPVTSEKMSQFTSFVLFTFADYTVARWAAKTTWLISLPEVIHIKDGHMPTE